MRRRRLEQPSAGGAAGLLRSGISAVGPLLGLAAVWLLFATQAGGKFWRWENQRLILEQTAVVGTAAVGATLVIISGGIDLSVGTSSPADPMSRDR